MVSFSFTTLLLVTLVAISQIVVASPFYPPRCNEIHAKVGSGRKYVDPKFTPGKTSAVILKQWRADEHTHVQVKHMFQTNGDILLIKTKASQATRIELGFRTNGGDSVKRHFKVQPNYTCWVDTTTDEEAQSLHSVNYYERIQ